MNSEMLKNFWTNRVTLYSLCGDKYVRTALFDYCFWKREDSLIYENGRRRKLRKFLVRIPDACLIEPGDVLALGDNEKEIDREFLEMHAEDAFRVDRVLVAENTRCGGVSVE